MKNLIFILMAVALVNVSFANDMGQKDEVECTKKINKNRVVVDKNDSEVEYDADGNVIVK